MRKSKAVKKKIVGKPRGRNGGRKALGSSASDRRGRSLYCTTYERGLLQAFLDIMHISDDLNKIVDGDNDKKQSLWEDFVRKSLGWKSLAIPQPGQLMMNEVYSLCDFGKISISGVYRDWKKIRFADDAGSPRQKQNGIGN